MQLSASAGDQTSRPALALPLEDEIVRPRLIERLAERWNVRVVIVEAPGGYGKSVAIAQAISDNDSDPSGLDAFARCRVGSDALASMVSRLLIDLATAGDGREPVEPVPIGATPEQLADLVVQHITRVSPVDVSIWIDDLHLHDRIDGLALFVETLMDRMPRHAHLVLAGRATPRLRLARLRAADDVIEVGADELSFEPAETAQLAEHHGVEADRLARGAGWPAVTRLLVVSGMASSTEFVIEEVVDQLDEDQRRALAVAVIAGEATPAMLAAVGCGVDVRDLLRSVPLLSDVGSGAFAAHDLWHEVLDRLASPERCETVARSVAADLARRGDHPAAADIALRHGAWRDAADHIMDAFEAFDLNVEVAQVERWLSVLPPEAGDHPATMFLRGVHTRLSGDIRGGTDLVRAAASEFEAADQLERATTAVLELALQAWMLDDADTWTDMFTRSQRIVRAGGVRMAASSASGRVVAAELSGDFGAALAVYESLDELDEVSLGHAATLSLLVGEPQKSLGHLEELMRRFPRASVAGQLRGVRWNMGDPATVADVGDYASDGFSNPRDHVRAVFIESMIEASFGKAPDAERVSEQAWDRGREQAFAALAHGARDLVLGTEAAAAGAFDDRLQAIGWDDELMWGELRRYLPYAYVLSSRCRERFEGEQLGPLHRDLLRLARSFVGLRNGVQPAVLAAPSSIVAWLPLPWSVELAVRLAAVGDRRADDLIALLSDLGGANTHQELRRLKSSSGVLERGADALLAEVAVPPTEPTELVVCSTFALRRGGADVDVRRRRVRQLIALLVLRKDWTRDTIMSALWPGDDERGRGNLRATLSHARKLLEPDRRSGEASYHLRHRDDRVWLHRDEHLQVDLWKVEHQLSAARSAEQRGDVDEAIVLRRAALESTSIDLLTDLDDIDAVRDAIGHLRHRILSAGAWVGEQLLARGDIDAVDAVVEQLLETDPHLERAHALSIGARLAAGDLSGAASAVDLARRSLVTLGVQPTAGTEMLIRRFERRIGSESNVG
ncbi:MAG: BTAD domain-containing putative transcriptional regulator [Ilumatobacter sp.]